MPTHQSLLCPQRTDSQCCFCIVMLVCCPRLYGASWAAYYYCSRHHQPGEIICNAICRARAYIVSRSESAELYCSSIFRLISNWLCWCARDIIIEMLFIEFSCSCYNVNSSIQLNPNSMKIYANYIREAPGVLNLRQCSSTEMIDSNLIINLPYLLVAVFYALTTFHAARASSSPVRNDPIKHQRHERSNGRICEIQLTTSMAKFYSVCGENEIIIISDLERTESVNKFVFEGCEFCGMVNQ